MKMKLHRCCECGDAIAVWYNESGRSKTRFYCDKCVPRGSVCNVDNIEDFGEPHDNNGNSIMWWGKESRICDLLNNGSLDRDSDSFFYEYLDEYGRRSPSDDFSFCKDGFPIQDDEVKSYITYDTLCDVFDRNAVGMTFSDYCTVKDAIGEIFLKYRNKYSKDKIEYTILMSKFGEYVYSIIGYRKLTPRYIKEKYKDIDSIRKFYNKFKDEIYRIKRRK